MNSVNNKRPRHSPPITGALTLTAAKLPRNLDPYKEREGEHVTLWYTAK